MKYKGAQPEQFIRKPTVEQFKKYPILGCTTVLDMARVASGYDPNGDMNDANKEKYQNYVNENA